MKIVADANIIHVQQLYQQYGELVLKSGRDIGNADVSDAQVLIVRSITRVDEALLAGSQIKLVLTATSGTDHLDLDYLHKAGIAVKDAAGSNANAVVEYCLAALAELIISCGFSLHHKRVGIVGFGHVGSRLYKALSILGMECVVCDPFVENMGAPLGADSPRFCSLDEALGCDVVSLHTPLTRGGEHDTYHLINRESLKLIHPGSLLINASRGAVVDNSALYGRLRDQKDLLCVLDVWENEPNINQDLLALVNIATPHIAGYSVEAKTSASQMNFASFQAHFSLENIESTANKQDSLIAIASPSALAKSASDELKLAHCLRAGFAVKSVDAQLRSCGKSNATSFDSIRKAMTGRREFLRLSFDSALRENGLLSDAVASQLTRLNFGFIDR
jgi:erythronate-4-phosphate dehydrogenase